MAGVVALKRLGKMNPHNLEPLTVLSVAMALPDGDPIAARVMVAASGEKEGLDARTLYPSPDREGVPVGFVCLKI